MENIDSFEKLFNKIKLELEQGISPYKAFRKIYARIRKRKCAIKEFYYKEKSKDDIGILKLRIRKYKEKGYEERVYKLKSEKNPKAVKHLAAIIDVFLRKYLPRKIGEKRKIGEIPQSYFEGYDEKGRRMGTKHYKERLEEYEKNLCKKYNIKEGEYLF